MPDKCALVIGGTRRVGRWVSEALLVSGCSVAAVFKSDAASAQQFQTEMKTAGMDLALIQADMSVPQSAADAISAAAENLGGLDILVVCCGPSFAGSILATPADELVRLWDNNVRVVHNCTVPAAAHLRRSENGRIICFLSAGTDSVRAFTEIPVYAACKTMLAGYLRSLAKELSGSTVTVNSVSLGLTQLDAEGAPGADDKGLEKDRLIAQEDVAAAVWYLCAESSSKVTGTVINLSAGFGL